MTKSSTAFSDSKKHYKILDGLRGVAAIVVVLFHVLEIYSGGDHVKQLINHGYLAVDFFFALSGFVIGHAYDDRWHKLSVKQFFKRRLVRLHPMIILGMVLGALCFYFGESDYFPKIADTSVLQLIITMLIGFTLLPLPVSMDIRGWSEMHPLDGPAWSLFFEYIANILYALFLRKIPNKFLAVLVFIAGAALIHFAVTSPNGDVIGGWALVPDQLRIGFTRLLYPFLAGLLLSRMVKPGNIKMAFLWCSILLVGILAFPRVGGHEQVWMNGLYDSLTIIILFPIIIYMGASGEIKNKGAEMACTFLGDISYPIYIIHYPLLYVFYAWVENSDIPMRVGVFVGVGIMIGCIALSYIILKLYDEPVRKWLTQRFLKAKA